MVVTVFRNRLRTEARDEYQVWIARMRDLAMTMPGYVSHKTFTADDGERVTIVEFESEAALAAWRNHPEHREVQARARSQWFADYRIQVCEVVRDYSFKA